MSSSLEALTQGCACANTLSLKDPVYPACKFHASIKTKGFKGATVHYCSPVIHGHVLNFKKVIMEK